VGERQREATVKPEEQGEVGGFDAELDAKLEYIEQQFEGLVWQPVVAEARKRLRLSMLPGFVCSACGVFTGDCKERQAACRCCGLARRSK
jgi:hypothetical protein